MVDYKYFDLFYKENVDKRAKIEYSGGVMTNKELFQNSELLTESLCSEKELRFGCCEAASLKFKVANIVKPMKGETVTFSIVIDHHEDKPILIGKYKVESDKETADRRYRDIVAYDAMYDIINADASEMAAWYNSLLPKEDSAVTMKQFRESFVGHFGLTEVLPKGGLVNDSMTIQRTIQPEQISGQDIITAICEINGCFGHIGRDGKFHYIYLPQAIEGLYPANDLYPDHAPEWMAQAKTGHLYPQDPKSTKIGKGSYIPPCNYESYRTKPITKLQIRMEENDIGKIWPEGEVQEKDNCYIIQDNFLVYGKSSDELTVIAQNIMGKITDIIYRPFDCTAVGNPCLEVGDAVRLNTTYEIVESYILTRTMKGIQALRDTYKAQGVQKYGEQVNGIHKSIIQLKGKANILTRTIEETKLEMHDIEKDLRSTITVTAGEIRAEVANSDKNLQSQIMQNASDIDLRVKKDGVIASINLSPETITLKANRIDLQGLVNATELTTKFATINSLNAVSAEVSRIDADYASVGDLNAESAQLQNLIADKASIGQLEAVDARFNHLNASSITTGTLSLSRLEVGAAGPASWKSTGHLIYSLSVSKNSLGYVTNVYYSYGTLQFIGAGFEHGGDSEA